MNKPWFYRLLFSYLPIFFITTSILILLIFLSISQLSKKEAEKANEAYVLHVMQSVDYGLRSIDEYLIKELQTDHRIEQFYTNQFEGNPYFSAYEITGKIREMMNYNKFIQSVYFYRASNQMVISPNTMITADRFGDGPFIAQMMEQQQMFQLSSQRIFQEFPESDERRKVVSLVRKVPLLTGQQGLIVVNIGMNAIQQMIEGMSQSRISFVDLYDAEGKLLVTSRGETEESAEAHRGSQLTRMKSTFTGWEYRSGFEDDRLFTYTTVFSYVWIGLGLLIVILGGVWMMYVTRRNYRPIESIIKRIVSYSGLYPAAPEANRQDEFQFIERALNNLIELSSKYEKRHEEDIVFRRRHFFKEWLEGNRAIAAEDWAVEMQRLQLPVHFERLSAGVVEIDKYVELSRMFSQRDQDLLKFVLSRVVQETGEQQNLTVWAEWTSNHRLGVVMFPRGDDKKCEQQAAELCESVRSWVEQNLHFRVTIGVGPVAEQVQDLVHSYDAAANVLRYKSTLGANRVIYYWESEAQAETEMYKHLPHVKAMAQAFRLGENWKQELEHIFAELKGGLFSREEIQSLLNYMVYHLYREMMELSADFQEMWKREALPHLNDTIDHFDTIEEVYTEWFRILEGVSGQMASLRGERSSHGLMTAIRSYIEENYTNPDLSLALLSEQFQVNATQLSRTFKEEFGEKFIDYLVKVRMEHAKHLLATTNEPVQDIASKVGYTHAISFIRAFKKYTGSTPGEYRKEE